MAYVWGHRGTDPVDIFLLLALAFATRASRGVVILSENIRHLDVLIGITKRVYISGHCLLVKKKDELLVIVLVSPRASACV